MNRNVRAEWTSKGLAWLLVLAGLAVVAMAVYHYALSVASSTLIACSIGSIKDGGCTDCAEAIDRTIALTIPPLKGMQKAWLQVMGLGGLIGITGMIGLFTAHSMGRLEGQ